MTLTHPIGNVNLVYTIDGGPADTEGILYTGPVELPGGCTIRVVAGGGFYSMSKEVSLYCSERSVLYAGDVKPGDWYFESIDRLVDMGVMNGVGNYNYAPNTKLTRGMMVTLLYRCSGEKLEEHWEKTNTFKDVRDNAYYTEAVEWAYRNKIVNGDSPTVFRPEGNITRQEMCKVIDGYLTYRQTPLERGESCKDKYADSAKIARWALSSVEAMTSAGLIRGDGTRVNPTGTATRAEVAAVLVRMLDYQAAYAASPDEAAS